MTAPDKAFDIATQIAGDHYARMAQAVGDIPDLKAPTKRELVKGYLRTQAGEMAVLRDAIAAALRENDNDR